MLKIKLRHINLPHLVFEKDTDVRCQCGSSLSAEIKDEKIFIEPCDTCMGREYRRGVDESK